MNGDCWPCSAKSRIRRTLGVCAATLPPRRPADTSRMMLNQRNMAFTSSPPRDLAHHLQSERALPDGAGHFDDRLVQADREIFRKPRTAFVGRSRHREDVRGLD